jgi:hypothetical protein
MSNSTKKCPYCAEEILFDAIKCKHCGEMTGTSPNSSLNRTNNQVFRQRLWSPGIAAVLSLFIPGAGHFYKNSISSGFVWLGCAAIAYWIWIPFGVILHIICIVNATQGDPYVDDSVESTNIQTDIPPLDNNIQVPEGGASNTDLSEERVSHRPLSDEIKDQTAPGGSDTQGSFDLTDHPKDEGTRKLLILFGVISFFVLVVILSFIFNGSSGTKKEGNLVVPEKKTANPGEKSGIGGGIKDNVRRAYVRTEYGSGLRIRSSPSENSDVIVTVPNGSSVIVLSETEDYSLINGEAHKWYRIEYGGSIGWSWGKYIVFR